MRKIAVLLSILSILTGCSFVGTGYPINNGRYVINSINTETAYVNNDDEVEIEVDGVIVKIYSLKTENKYGEFTYMVDGVAKPIGCLKDDEYNLCYLSNTSITTDDGNLIGLIQVPRRTYGAYDTIQKFLKKDILFELNPTTGESDIFYETEGNYQRIVGYDEGIVYLYENNRIYELDLSNNKKSLLKEIEPYEELEFDWAEEGLTIDNNKEDYHELIKIED